VTKDYSGLAAKQPLQLLLIRTLRLQLLHTMNTMGNTYNAAQMLVRSIFDTHELIRPIASSLRSRLVGFFYESRNNL
jgi:hypothetical protein